MKTLVASAAVFCFIMQSVIGGVLHAFHPTVADLALRSVELAVLSTVLVYTPIVGAVYYISTLLQCDCNCTRCTDHCGSCT